MIKPQKCSKCGSDKNIIHHHEKYLEIHGYDKVVMLCRSCHKYLHDNIRREHKCNIAPLEMRNIASNAKYRRYNMDNAAKRYKYDKENTRCIHFYNTYERGLAIDTVIIENKNTGHITIYCPIIKQKIKE